MTRENKLLRQVFEYMAWPHKKVGAPLTGSTHVSIEAENPPYVHPLWFRGEEAGLVAVRLLGRFKAKPETKKTRLVLRFWTEGEVDNLGVFKEDE